MNYIKIEVENSEYQRIPYVEKEDGWHVNTEPIDGDGWRRQYHSDAQEKDVRQLLKKEYDIKY